MWHCVNVNVVLIHAVPAGDLHRGQEDHLAARALCRYVKNSPHYRIDIVVGISVIGVIIQCTYNYMHVSSV